MKILNCISSGFTRLAFLFAFLVVVPSTSMAGDYSFTEITESSGGFSFPSINGAGTVAWIQDGGNSLMVGDGGPVTILYDTGGIGPFRGFGGH